MSNPRTYLWKSHKVAKLQDVHGDIFYSVNASHSEVDLRMNTNFDRLAFHMAYDFASLSSPPSSVSRKPTILHHYLGKDWQSLHLGTGALGKGSP